MTGTRPAAFAFGKGRQSLGELKERETQDLPRLADQAEMLGGACPMRMRGRASASCFAHETLYTRLVRQEGESAVVRTHQMLGEAWPGQRVLSRGESRPSHRLDAERYRLVCVELDYGDGYGVTAVLLRPLAWLESQGVVEGGEVHLDLEEKGAMGWGRVCWVRPSPAIEDGPGSLVTGWFYHWRGVLHELRVSGEPEPLRVTARHPFWSVDAQRWVPAIELAVGERLERADGGVAVVESLALREREEPVYNIEVEGDHCYRVGQQGLLVHNASAGDPKVTKVESTYAGVKVDLAATTAIVFKATDCSHPRWGITARLSAGGTLTFSVVTVDTANPSDRSTIAAGTFFAAALDWFGAGSVQEVYLQWYEAKGIDTNFQAFRSHYNPATDNRDAAAMETPSYKIVSKSAGVYSKITLVLLDPDDPQQFATATDRSVSVTCKR